MAALPNAPPKEAQTIKEPAMLHTTVARLLLPPAAAAAYAAAAAAAAAGAGSDPKSAAAAATAGRRQPAAMQDAVAAAVARLSQELCGLTTTFRQVHFVEELDLLALGLGGHYRTHVVPLECVGSGEERETGEDGGRAVGRELRTAAVLHDA